MDHTTRRTNLDEITYRSISRSTRIPTARPASTASVLIGSTAFVAVGYWFGAAWLKNPVLGIPVGLYAIIVLFAVIRWADAIRVERVSRKTTGSLGVLTKRCGAVLGTIPGLIASRLPRFARLRGVLNDIHLEIAQTTGEIASVWRSENHRPSASPPAPRPQPRAHGSAAGSGTTRHHDRPLRIGFDLPEAWADRLVHGDAGADGEEIVWIEAGDPTRSLGRACQDLDLDAIVRSDGAGTGSGRIRLLTRPGLDQDEAWDDWSRPGRLSYATVFPARLDPILVTLGGLDAPSIEQTPLARAVLVSASLLRRWALSGEPHDGERAQMTLRTTARRLRDALDQGQTSELVLAASRVTSAAACLWPDYLPTGERNELLEAIHSVLPDEAEITLRLAAVCAASMNDGRVRSLLVEASAQLAACDRLATINPLGFILSELEHSEGSGLCVGRVGAASCLLAAATDPREYPYVRDDLFDDMRYSPWLVGRDQDRAFLMELFMDRTSETSKMSETPKADTGTARVDAPGMAA